MTEGKTPRRRGRPRIEEPHPVDVHVGARIRLRRILLGMSPEKLGDELGLTFPQVQKYERAATRVSASRLHKIAEILSVPVSFFFDDMPEEKGGAPTPPTSDEEDIMIRPETLELARLFHQISDRALRRQILGLTKSIAGDRNPDPETPLDPPGK